MAIGVDGVDALSTFLFGGRVEGDIASAVI